MSGLLLPRTQFVLCGQGALVGWNRLLPFVVVGAVHGLSLLVRLTAAVALLEGRWQMVVVVRLLPWLLVNPVVLLVYPVCGVIVDQGRGGGGLCAGTRVLT